MAKKKTIEPPEFPQTKETFQKPDFWRRDVGEPNCFNGFVSVIKYRITYEVIEEPVEVIHERLEKLWSESDNHHHYTPLQNAAKKHGYIYKSTFGSKRPIKAK